ncbi:MAG: hypothetical protein HQL58_11925 [Magnetococcales bacterium]|nr:hypothetical protein [Magnetococcales bacterium]
MNTMIAMLLPPERIHGLLYQLRWLLFRFHYSLFHWLRLLFPGLGFYLLLSLERMHSRLIAMPEYWGNTDS